MTTTAKSGGARKGAAARREAAGKALTVKFGKLNLELPKALPPEILFDLAENEAGNDGNPLPVMRLLRSLLGAEQFSEVRNAIARGDAKFDEIGPLIEKAFAEYGVSAGEASAS